MKKVFLTIVVVMSLLLSSTLMSIAAPDDIPDALGPNVCVENPVEEF